MTDMLLVELFGSGVLLEVSLPPSHYGYWIDHDGGYHSVDDLMGHDRLAKEVLGDVEDPTGELFVKGWIRVVGTDTSNEASMAVSDAAPRRARSALARLLRSIGPKERYVLMTSNDDRIYYDLPSVARAIH